jgi:hypothetical protein
MALNSPVVSQNMTAEQQAMTLSMLVATLPALEMTYCWVTLEMTK